MTFGKAMEGGRALSQDEIDNLARDQMKALREVFAAHPAIPKTDDVMHLRLAEELRLVKRMLELAEESAKSPEAKRSLHQSADAVEDVAEIIEADDECDAIEHIDEDMARRLTRRSIDGSAAPCDNRRPADK